MSTIKVRYVAQIEINAEYDSSEVDFTIPELKERAHTSLKDEMQKDIAQLACDPEHGTVEVTEQFLDIYEVWEES